MENGCKLTVNICSVMVDIKGWKFKSLGQGLKNFWFLEKIEIDNIR